MLFKDLVIINNEEIFKENETFYCNNLDLKILPEGLNKYHDVQYIVRSSNKKGGQKINLENIKASSNIIKFIYFVLKTFKTPNVSYLLVCITPYTFLSFLILFLFRKMSWFGRQSVQIFILPIQVPSGLYTRRDSWSWPPPAPAA